MFQNRSCKTTILTTVGSFTTHIMYLQCSYSLHFSKFSKSSCKEFHNQKNRLKSNPMKNSPSRSIKVATVVVGG